MRHASLAFPTPPLVSRCLLLCVSTLLFLFATGCNTSNGSAPPHIPAYTSFDAPGAETLLASGTWPSGINNSGIVVGYFSDSTTAPHGFVRAVDGTISTFDVPRSQIGFATGTTVSGVNSSGTVVGSYYDSGVQQWLGFTRTSAGDYSYITSVTFGPGGSRGIQPTSIANNGELGGYFFDSLAMPHAFVFPANSVPIYIAPPEAPLPGTWFAQVNSVSSTGDAVGFFAGSIAGERGFLLHTDGSITTLAALGPGNVTYQNTKASMVSSNGSIVGSVSDGQATHSFLRTPDGAYTIFDPPFAGPAGSEARFINSSGMIAGSFTDTNLTRHGYLRNADATYTLIDEPNIGPTGFTFISGMNDAGEIVGSYSDAQGSIHGFLRK